MAVEGESWRGGDVSIYEFVVCFIFMRMEEDVHTRERTFVQNNDIARAIQRGCTAQQQPTGQLQGFVVLYKA